MVQALPGLRLAPSCTSLPIIGPRDQMFVATPTSSVVCISIIAYHWTALAVETNTWPSHQISPWPIHKAQLWFGTPPIHSLVCLHNDIIHSFGSFLNNSGHFWLTSNVSTTFLLVELVVIKNGHHVVSCSYQQPRGGWRSYSLCSLKGRAIPPNII